MTALAPADVRVNPIVVRDDGSEVHLGDIFQTCVWSEDPGEVAMHLQVVVLADIPTPYGELHTLLNTGARMRLDADWGQGAQTLGTFHVFHRFYRDDGHRTVEIHAYDDLIALVKSDVTIVLDEVPTPANQVIQKVLKLPQFSSWHFTLGDLSGPTAPIWQQVYRAQKAIDTINTLLRWAFMRTPPDDPEKFPYFIQIRDGAVSLLQPGQNTQLWLLEDTQGLANLEEETSLDDLITEVGLVMLTSSGTASTTPPAQNGFYVAQTMTLPDPSVNYRAVADEHLGQGSDFTLNQTDPSVINRFIQADIADLLQQADVQDVQKTGLRIRREIVLDPNNAFGAQQAAFNILTAQDRPWRTERYDCPLIPSLRRGDAIYVRAGTIDGVLIVTGVEHEAATMTSHLTVDSAGILGQRVSRQHYTGPFADEDDTVIAFQLANAQEAAGHIGAAGATEAGLGAGGLTPGRVGPWLAIAQSALGTTYVFGGPGGRTSFVQPLSLAGGTDCSGFVSWVFKLGFGIDLRDGGSVSTFSLFPKTEAITEAEAQPGDLIFYNLDSSDPTQQHVAIYIGNGQVIQDGGIARLVNIGQVWQPIGSPPTFRRLPALQAALGGGS